MFIEASDGYKVRLSIITALGDQAVRTHFLNKMLKKSYYATSTYCPCKYFINMHNIVQNSLSYGEGLCGDRVTLKVFTENSTWSVVAVCLEWKWNVPFPSNSGFCHDESHERAEIWVRNILPALFSCFILQLVIFCLQNRHNDCKSIMWHLIS